MRSSLLIYSTTENIQEAGSILLSRLRVRRVRCSVAVGETRKSSSHVRSRRQPIVPPGTGFLSVDICRSYKCKAHMELLTERLGPILEECETIGLLKERHCPHKRVDITASNGSDDSEWARVFYLAPELMRICVKFGIGIRLDVLPRMDDG